MFESVVEGEHVDNLVMVIGYVIMRVAMSLQWLRVAIQDPSRRTTALVYLATILVAQVGWLALAIAETSVATMFVWAAVLVVIEIGGPVLAEYRQDSTPWHAHHIAERHGLMVIIALGEGLIGTVAAMRVIVGPEGPGYSTEFVVVGLAGLLLVFGVWWTYFVIPCGELLHHHRERSFGWGYLHIVVFGAVVAIGAGVQIVASYIDHHSQLGPATRSSPSPSRWRSTSPASTCSTPS